MITNDLLTLALMVPGYPQRSNIVSINPDDHNRDHELAADITDEAIEVVQELIILSNQLESEISKASVALARFGLRAALAEIEEAHQSHTGDTDASLRAAREILTEGKA